MKRLLVGTVPSKNSKDVIGRNSPTIIIMKRLMAGTVPPKKINEEVIRRNSPTKK